MIVRLEDARSLGYCNAGLRAFARRHNLDWRDFVVNGISESELSGIDDAMLQAVVAQARERENEQE